MWGTPEWRGEPRPTRAGRMAVRPGRRCKGDSGALYGRVVIGQNFCRVRVAERLSGGAGQACVLRLRRAPDAVSASFERVLP